MKILQNRPYNCISPTPYRTPGLYILIDKSNAHFERFYKFYCTHIPSLWPLLLLFIFLIAQNSSKMGNIYTSCLLRSCPLDWICEYIIVVTYWKVFTNFILPVRPSPSIFTSFGSSQEWNSVTLLNSPPISNIKSGALTKAKLFHSSEFFLRQYSPLY